MPIFSEPAFALTVAGCYVLGQLVLPFSRSNWFGLLNLIAVVLLFGWRAAAALLALSFVYWVVLALSMRWRSSHGGVGNWATRAFAWALYASVGLLFLFHKSILEPGHDFLVILPFQWIASLALLSPVERGFGLLQLLAVSYVVLRLIDAIRAVLDGARLMPPLAFSGYVMPFFMTPAGPVNVYADHLLMDERPAPSPTAAHFVDCVFTIVAGYFLKFVLAQLFSIYVIGLDGAWHGSSVGETALFLVYILLEFGGYSLIALGVGRLLGVPTPVNFNHPYLATTVGEFWSRWHMSLGGFVRRNLYIPMQVALMRRWGRKNREFAYYANVLALWLPFTFVGIWHRLSWTFLLWGILVGAIVAMEKLARDKVIPRAGFLSAAPWWVIKPLGIAYTLTMVVVTLTIAAGEFVQ